MMAHQSSAMRSSLVPSALPRAVAAFAALPALGQPCPGSWSNVLHAGDTPTVRALAAFDDDGPGPHRAALYAGGQLDMLGGAVLGPIARWNGAAWTPLGAG